MTIKFNLDKHVLGAPCKNGHRYESTGKTVRYKNSNQCVLCARARRRNNMNDDRLKEGKTRLSGIKAKCPKCRNIHYDVKGIVYLGTGTPWFYCNGCKEELAAVDNGMAVGF